MIKECSKCGANKPHKDFYKDRRMIDGVWSYCKECAKEVTLKYERSKLGVTGVIYGAQVKSSKHRGHPLPEYSKDFLREWLYSHDEFHKMYSRWVESGYDRKLKPSVDRIDDNVGYRLDNIRLVEWRENHSKQATKDKGQGSFNAKPYQHYETKSTPRSQFKVACKRNGWNFGDFFEEYRGDKGSSGKRYFYIKK